MPILNESIVEDAALNLFGELGYAIGDYQHMAPGEPATDDVFGLPPRISIPSSPNLSSSSSYLVARSSVLPAISCDLKEVMP